MKSSGQRILVSPSEVLIDGLETGKIHVEVVTLTNTMSVPVSIELSPRASSERKHEISPSTARIGPKDTQQVTIKTTLMKYPRHGFYIRDVILINSEYFTEKFYLSIKPKFYSKEESGKSSKKIDRLEEEIRAYDEEIESLHEKFLEKSHAENELSRLSKENSDLKLALEEANRGSIFSQKMSELYKEKASVEQLVEMRLQEEKEKNDRKNLKILEVLKQKDETIEEYKNHVKELTEKLSDLHTKLLMSKKDLQRFQLSEQSNQDLEKTIQDQQDIISGLKNELKTFQPLQSQNKELESQVLAKVSIVQKLEAEIERLKSREESILSLSSLQELAKARQLSINSEKDQIIIELQSKVSSQSNFIDLLLTNPLNSHQDLLSKILSLETENRHLCSQIGRPAQPDAGLSNQLDFEISMKNREIIQLQNQVLHLQNSSPAESQKALSVQQQKNSALAKQVDELNKLVEGLESSNKDLQSQISNLLQGVNSEAFVQSVASQTQLVSRLNSRVLALKEREDLALKKLAESEELVKELKKVLNGQGPSKLGVSKEVQTESIVSESKDLLEKIRYERKINDLGKEANDSRNSLYEKLKETHKLKEELIDNEIRCLKDLAKLQKENLELSEKIENLQDLSKEEEAKTKELKLKLNDFEYKNKVKDEQLEKNESQFRAIICDLEVEVQELKLEIKLKDSCIQERTKQVAVLMENLEGSLNREDLAIEVSHLKAIEGSLNRQIIELKSINQDLSFQLSQEGKRSSSLSQRLESVQAAGESSKSALKKLENENEDLKSQTKDKEIELSSLRLALMRLQENEKDYKNRIEMYIQRINHLQRVFSSDLAREREAFLQEIMRFREESEPFDLELSFHRPIVRSLNELSISLKNGLLDADQLKENFKEIILDSDKLLFQTAKKLRDLEFQLKISDFFRFLDPENINLVQKLSQQVFELSEELKIWKNPKNMPNPEIYTSRIKLLEKELQSRTQMISSLEGELAATKKEYLSVKSSINSQKLRNKSEEIHGFIQERTLSQRIEEDLKTRFKLRDEEIKGYLDSHLTKILLGSPESSKLFELTREISSLKIIINELESKLNNEAKANEALQRAYEELNELTYQNDKLDFSVNISQNSSLLMQVEQKAQELHKVKEANEHRKEENAFLQQKVAELKKELLGLRGFGDSKKREDELVKEIKEIKEQHRREIQTIKANSQDLLQAKIEELENQKEKTVVREPEFIENPAVVQENLKLKQEVESSQSKMSALSDLYGKVKDEIEIYRTALKEGMIVNIEEVKQGKKTEKKLTLEKSKSSAIFRLTRSLLSAKIGEADSLKKLKTASESLTEIQQSFQALHSKHTALQSQLEKLLRYLKSQKVPVPDLSIDAFEHLPQSINQEESQDFIPLSLKLDPVSFPNTELGDILESIIYLCNQLVNENQDPNTHIEQVQRIVIKSLHDSLRAYLKPSEPVSTLLDFKPSSKQDAKLWYVELVESQSELFSNTVQNLIEFINKTSIDVSGNLLSIAQYKGAALEIAQKLKLAANELDLLKNVCFLIRCDLNDTKGTDFSDYKERAYLAEALKRKIEEEMMKLKVEQSYKAAEDEDFITQLKEENEKLSENQEKFEKISQEMQKEQIKAKSSINKLELELKQSQEKYLNLDKTCSELLEAKEILVKRNEKLAKEHKAKIAEMQEQVIAKDRIVAEVQKQNKILQDERAKIHQEAASAKKQNRELKTEIENVRTLKDAEKELRETKEAKREIEDMKSDMRRLVETHKKEIEQVLVAVNELEDKNKKLSSKYKRAKNYITSKVKNKEEDAELLKHTFNAQLMTVKTESKEKIKELNAQVSNLQSLLKEKMLEVDQESKKRQENEEKQKNLHQIEIDSQMKLAILEEKLKNQTSLYEQETKKLAKELEKSRQDHEKLVMKLQENFTSAEILADFISKSEQEKRNLESVYKSETSIFHRKEKEKESYIDSLKKKLAEMTEKIKDFEQKQFDLNNAGKEIQDLKYKISDLSNTKVQQRSKIKELESKIREFEVLKDSDEHKFSTKLEEIAREARLSYEEFEKTTARLEGVIEGLKEQFACELKRLKCPKKSVESLDFMFQIAKRDGMIKALKKEIKLKTTPKKTANVSEETVRLQNQNFKFKGIIKNLEVQLAGLKDEAQKLKAEIDMNVQINEEIIEKEVYTKKEMNEIEKKYKSEIRVLLEDYNRLLHNKVAN